jgi:hypothetical protein
MAVTSGLDVRLESGSSERLVDSHPYLGSILEFNANDHDKIYR